MKYRKKKRDPRFNQISLLIGFILISHISGILGQLFTVQGLEWYFTLAKPSFAPPVWVFGPIWLTLYTIMGIAAFLVYRTGSEGRSAMGIFAIQLLLNAAWSPLFFGLRSPALALADIILLWGAIMITINRFMNISKKAGYLLVPYLIWVMIAATINVGILFLNT